VKTDNGSEFALYFGEALERASTPHFFSRPKIPKDLAILERSHRTDDDEFYDLTELPLDLVEANALLREYVRTYNMLRPHQALGYQTPAQALARNSTGKPKLSDGT
jgi:transposase InsO family protein